MLRFVDLIDSMKGPRTYPYHGADSQHFIPWARSGGERESRSHGSSAHQGQDAVPLVTAATIFWQSVGLTVSAVSAPHSVLTQKLKSEL
jgi:hypothetical protein